MEVHSNLGCGFLEEVYQEALQRELDYQKIPYESQVRLQIYYRGEPLNKYYIADLICYGDIIVELKATSENSDAHIAQVCNYLVATELEHGLLLNFGQDTLYHRHIVNSN